jgi:hypothetical protein
VVEPDPGEHAVYDRLHALYRSLYFAMGQRDAGPAAVGRVLPDLQALSQRARRG